MNLRNRTNCGGNSRRSRKQIQRGYPGFTAVTHRSGHPTLARSSAWLLFHSCWRNAWDSSEPSWTPVLVTHSSNAIFKHEAATPCGKRVEGEIRFLKTQASVFSTKTSSLCILCRGVRTTKKKKTLKEPKVSNTEQFTVLKTQMLLPQCLLWGKANIAWSLFQYKLFHMSCSHRQVSAQTEQPLSL